MALKLEDKKAIVAEVAAVATQAVAAAAVDYRGLTVAEMTQLRAKARKSGIYVRVVRNTLARRAVAGTNFACMQEILTGPLFLAFSAEELGAVARLLQEATRDYEKLTVSALVVEGKLYGANELATIAKLPTRQQVLATLLAGMQAPIGKLVRTLAEPYALLVRAVAAVGDKKAA